MIGYKEAVAAAKQYVAELFRPEELRGLRVEELSPSDDEKYWNVTLGWVESEVRTVSASAFTVSGPELVRLPRVYKRFKIDAESGDVISMGMKD